MRRRRANPDNAGYPDAFWPEVSPTLARAMKMRGASSGLLMAAGILIIATNGQAAASSPFTNIGSFSAGHDNNLRAARANEEKAESLFYSLRFGTRYRKQLSLHSALSGRLQLQGNYYNRFSKLSNGRMIGSLRLSHRTGNQFFSPTISLWGTAARIAYGSEIRSGNEYRAGLMLLQNLTTKIRATLEIRGFERESKGVVFDLAGAGGGLTIAWKISPKIWTRLGYDYLDGDSFSSAAPTIDIVRAAEAIEADDAFGGLAANQFAYRIDAHTQVGSLGMNYRLARDYLLDLRLQSINVDAEFGIRYRRWIGTVGLLVRF